MFAKSLCRIGVIWGLLSVVTSLHAGIVITGTRVIYPSDQKTVTVQVKNEGAHPVLMQTWIDNGNASLTPDEMDVPFVVMPPISRVEKNTGQSINISYIESGLAQDRESIYWLNVLDVPSKPEVQPEKEVAAAVLQVAVRSRIKMFYRPAHLKDGALTAGSKLQWQRLNQNLIVKNPTPYYVNISSLEVSSNKDQVQEFLTEGLMLAPFEEKQVEIKGFNYNKFKVLSINDFGGLDPIEVELNH